MIPLDSGAAFKIMAPAANARAILYQRGESAPAAQTIADRDGFYLFENMPRAEYFVAADLDLDRFFDLGAMTFSQRELHQKTKGVVTVAKKREPGTSWIDASVDGQNYCPGEIINLTLSGKIRPPLLGAIVAELVNRKTEKIVWSSAPVSAPVDENFLIIVEAEVDSEWPATNSSGGADYFVYARLASELPYPAAISGNTDNLNILEGAF